MSTLEVTEQMLDKIVEVAKEAGTLHELRMRVLTMEESLAQLRAQNSIVSETLDGARTSNNALREQLEKACAEILNAIDHRDRVFVFLKQVQFALGLKGRARTKPLADVAWDLGKILAVWPAPFN